MRKDLHCPSDPMMILKRTIAGTEEIGQKELTMIVCWYLTLRAVTTLQVGKTNSWVWGA